MTLEQANKILTKYDWCLSINYDPLEDNYGVYVGDSIEDPSDWYDDYDQVLEDWANTGEK